MSTHIKKVFCFIFVSFCWTFVHAEIKYPVDISYLVTDFKYSQEHGIKICEVQHGVLSALRGDVFVAGKDGNIPPRFAEYFEQFSLKKWVVGSIYKPLMHCLSGKKWAGPRSLQSLKNNSAFLQRALVPPSDPSSISSYAGIVYATRHLVKDFDIYRETYPGIIFMDAAIAPYWIDKYKVSLLFNENEELKQYKADWEIYPKTYTQSLASTIQENMPSEMYVIKPRGEFLGHGVIIVASEKLDEVLKLILEPATSLKEHSDESYSYWWNNNDDTFLIEKYYASDYLQFTSKLSEKADAIPTKYGANYHYDATMRIVFMMEYNEGEMSYHCLGGYWKLPCRALEEQGTLNERRISCGELPYYRAVDPKLFEEINAQMERAMLLLYEVMLNDQNSS